MSRKNGGIIGPANTPVGGLFKGVASGVWRTNDVLNYVGNNQWPTGPQDIENSCRFDNGSTDYLSRTLSTPTNSKKFTFSAWVKKSNDKSGGHYLLDTVGTSAGSENAIAFDGDQKFRVGEYTGSNVFNTRTTAVFRDPSAWYHCFIKGDSTQSTASDRVKIYVNGLLQEVDNEYPSLNYDFKFNVSGNVINIGRGISNSNRVLDGYLAEYVFIDGTALDPTSFGEFDSATGIWKPKKIGAFASAGTNSFYLDFKDSSNLGNDASGLNNDFTVNNLTSVDQTVDTCVENFCTLNPLHFGSGSISNTALSEGNLKFVSTQGGSPYPYYISTMAVSKGKWYAEFKFVSSDSGTAGIGNGVADQYAGNNAYDYSYYFDGRLYNGGSSESTGYSAISNNDILGCALDLDNNKIYFHINGTYQASGDPTAGSGGKSITAAASNGTGVYHFEVGDSGANQPTIECNFGNPPFSISSGNSDANGFGNFEYAVPSGYYALNTSNLNTYG